MVNWKSLATALLISTAAVAATSSAARADFVFTTASDWQTPATSLNINTTISNPGSMSYLGHVGGNFANQIGITTTTNTTAGSGNAIITPAGTGQNQDIFSSVTFTPIAGLNYTSFSTQGSLPDNGNVTITLVDNGGQTFTWSVAHNALFGPFGVEAIQGTGETITSVTVSTDDPNGFVNVKLIDFGFASAVPEPATWAMLVFGFAGVGFMAYRRKSGPLFRVA